MTLRWDAPEDDGGAGTVFFEYSYWETGQSSETVTPLGSNPIATVHGLTNGTRYVFAVRATNTAGKSAWTMVEATAAALPGPPQNLTAVPGDGKVTLTWAAPASDGGAPVIRYEYSYGLAGGSLTTGTSVGTNLTVTVDGLTNGRDYNFLVWAVNGTGNGQWTILRDRPAAEPGPVQNLSARVGDGFAFLNWEEPASDGGSQIVGHQYRYAAGSSVQADTAWIDAGAKPLPIFDLTNGTEYAFEVRARNKQGSGAAVAITAIPTRTPNAPQNLKATPGDGQVALFWNAPAHEDGVEIAGYEFRYAEGGSVPAATDWMSVGLNRTATVSNLTNGTAYAFEVRTVNSAGNSPLAFATATPEADPVVTVRPEQAAYRFSEGAGAAGVVIVARAEAGVQRPNRSFQVSVVTMQITGGAVSPEDYAPLSVEISFAPDDFSDVGGAWEARKTVALTIVDDSDVEADEALETRLQLSRSTPSWVNFREADGVTACGGGGCLMTVTIADNDGPPGAPQNLTAAPGDRKVTLKWQAPASDGGSAIDRYEYRYTLVGSLTRNAAGNTTGNSTPAGKDWTSVGMDRNVTTNSLANGKKYTFEVRAVNGAGPGAAARATVLPATEPDAPRNFKAKPGDGQVTLTWQPPASDGGSPVRAYIYRYAAGKTVPAGTAWTTLAGTVRTVTIAGLVNGTAYAFELLAINSAGSSDTATATATPLAPPSVAELQRHIAGFMLNRANALVNNQPGLTRFLKAGGPINRLTGLGTERRGAVRGSLQIQDLWLDIRGAWSFADGAKSRYSFGTAGSHWRLNEQLLAGLMVQFDMVDESLPGGAGEIAGTGWLAGPYFAAKLEGQPLFFEGRLLYGRTDNRLDHALGVSGDFGTARWLAQFRMEGEVDLDAGPMLTPFADLIWTRDRQRSFADSLGRHVGGQTVSLGQAKIGIDFRLPLEAPPGTLAMAGGAAGVFSTADGGAAGAGFDGARARLHLGLDYRLDDAYGVALKGYYDGIGAPGYRSYGLAGELKIRF